jgi:hypothetical protein
VVEKTSNPESVTLRIEPIIPVLEESIPLAPHKTSLPFTILLSKQSHISGDAFLPLGQALALRLAIGNLVPFEGLV